MSAQSTPPPAAQRIMLTIHALHGDPGSEGKRPSAIGARILFAHDPEAHALQSATARGLAFCTVRHMIGGPTPAAISISRFMKRAPGARALKRAPDADAEGAPLGVRRLPAVPGVAPRCARLRLQDEDHLQRAGTPSPRWPGHARGRADAAAVSGESSWGTLAIERGQGLTVFREQWPDGDLLCRS